MMTDKEKMQEILDLLEEDHIVEEFSVKLVSTSVDIKFEKKAIILDFDSFNIELGSDGSWQWWE